MTTSPSPSTWTTWWPPRGALWQGALLGAVAFEALKLASGYVLTAIRGNPAFQVLGATLILLVWINYFSRVVIYSAAWAHTSGRARDARSQRAAAHPAVATPTTVSSTRTSAAFRARVAFAAGAAAALAMVAFARRRLRRSPP